MSRILAHGDLGDLRSPTEDRPAGMIVHAGEVPEDRWAEADAFVQAADRSPRASDTQRRVTRAKQQASALVLWQPDAAETKGLGEKVEVAVDVQDVCTVLLGARADDQVRQRDAMLPARGQLTLGGFGA